jgi:Uma2 family endonuclease
METNSSNLIEEYQSEDIMSLNHSRIINRVGVALSPYDNEYDVFPELELELTTGKCKPDVAVYKNLPADWLNDVMYFNQAPIIAVEVLSPKQAVTDLTDKALNQYFPAGVQVVWIIVPTLRIVQALLPGGSMQTWASGVMRDPVTGMEVDLGYLFKH